MNFVGKLLPGEGYQVCIIEEAPVNYSFSLSHLYQPLSGIEAVALYRTLLDETVFPSAAPKTHHHLMNYLNLPLDQIYEARLKLEALGLLRTFEGESSGVRIFHYELLPPLAPAAFFKEAALAGMLLQQLGEHKFSHLETLVMPKRQRTEQDTEVTATFDEVFGKKISGYTPVNGSKQEKVERGPRTSKDIVDFNWLAQSLKQQMLPYSKILSEGNRRVISQMASLHGLHVIELEKAIYWALTEENEIDQKKFSEACLDLADENARQGERAKPVPEQLPANSAAKEATKIEGRKGTLLYKFETMTPRELLEDFSNGNSASRQDLRMISDIMIAQGLEAPVMNVLIHYTLLQKDMKLPKAYLEKIASNWSRAKLKTAKEAIEYAKKAMNPPQEKKSGSKNYYSRNVKKEVVPDWIRKKASGDDIQQSSSPKDEQQNQAEIANVLNQLIQKN
ncbi:DnaD domain protein [Aciduricibacillus chroicocephali]|uniref:DnaD domain protein n=1 Tax=Aciduricibacillus chroicocephali TaxID=3054939 RepID=A0ABY9KSR8_9BACI|nr:DnaD domain protein [Bacillaceae bacterium 44XB]